MRSLASYLMAGAGVFTLVSPIAAQAQKGFATPDEAARELVQAASDFNVPSLLEILGPESKDLVATEDPVADKTRATAFAALAREKVSVVTSRKSVGRVELVVGKDDWPFPIPIVNRKGKWYFDTRSGRQEMLLRRVGENELDAIQICRGYVEAQRAYALETRGASGVHEYAQRIISTPGKHDGLTWRNPDGSWGGPIAESISKALTEGYSPGNSPYHGYYFKILKGQGPAAPLGDLDFVINGVMIGGFALAAAPAQYRVTGVQTFIVSHDGVVYQKDLGPDTLTMFKNMERYNPDKTWRVTKDEP